MKGKMFAFSGFRFWLGVMCVSCIVSAACTSVPPSFAAEEASPRVQEQGIRVHADRISIDVRNAPIREVLREIAKKAGLDIVPGEGVSGEVSIQLTDATIEEALEQLCRNRALVYEYLPETGGYRIVRALAVASDGKERGKAEPSTAFAERSPGFGSAAGRASSGALADRADGKPGLGTAPGGTAGETGAPARPPYKSGELLVRFKPGTTGLQMEELHRSLGSAALGNLPKLRLQRIRLREGLPEKEAIALYAASDIVEHAERHALRYPNRASNDPYADLQWGLANIKAAEAWDIASGKPEVVVAVIDTGVDYRHPDLQGNIWINTVELSGAAGVDDDGNGHVDDIRGWDFAAAGNDPMDKDGHGTHVSGIIAAAGNNGLGISGINWHARIMALKVEADNGQYFEDFAVIAAIRYAIDQGAKIVNCSFGGSARSDNEEAAFTALKDAGVLAVCAAGNDAWNNDSTAFYPSGYNLDNIISVAASDSEDRLASFSNYGSTSVDLMAPGVSIYSTILEGSETNARVRVEGADPVEYAALGMRYAGQTGENGITGTVHDCGQGYADQFHAGVSGNIALIRRGNRDGVDFYFYEKVQNAQTAGARGVIIYNHVVDDLDINGGSLGVTGDWIPAVSVTRAAGEALIALGNPSVTLINKPVDIPYYYMSGTSMAAPHVAGVAGLILARCPSLGYLEIRSAILDTVDKIGSVAGMMATGGRLNAAAALKSLLLPGDLTGDCRIGLDDAILVLQMIAGLPTPASYPSPTSQVPAAGNDPIGLQEAIFILQTAAGLRQ
jgi:subtilisin family serine protease